MGIDVGKFCLEFLNNGKDIEDLNLTEIVLIPKYSNPTNLANFRPISFCTVVYKIIAKSIANRMQAVIGRCIDSAQSAFVTGRLISDNILIAYEVLHTLRQRHNGK